MTKISTVLLRLREVVESVTYVGDFLLSVNKFSHCWVFIDELWTKHTDSYGLIESSLKIAFQNLLAEYGSFTVFSAGSHTGTSEEELPMYKIADDAIKGLKNNSIEMLRVILDLNASSELRHAIHPSKYGKYVGVFAFSLHTDLITELVNNLRSRGCDVVAIVTLIERDKVSRKNLSDLGIKLIPLIVVDDISGRPQTILETTELPYRDMHKYFQDTVKK